MRALHAIFATLTSIVDDIVVVWRSLYYGEQNFLKEMSVWNLKTEDFLSGLSHSYFALGTSALSRTA